MCTDKEEMTEAHEEAEAAHLLAVEVSSAGGVAGVIMQSHDELRP